jgi:diacylglycerol kinase (ATP)
MKILWPYSGLRVIFQDMTIERTLKAGVLINPMSHRNLKDLADLSKITDEFRVLERRVVTPEDLAIALAHFAHNNVNLIVISGGDGTVQAVLTALFHKGFFDTLPLLAVLRGGTTNMTAGDIGISGNQVRALRHLLRWAKTGYDNVIVEKRAVMRLEIPGIGVRYGMFFAAGGICQGMQYYQQRLYKRGLCGLPGICLTLMWYMLFAVTRSRNIHPIAIQALLDNRPFAEKEVLFLAITTLNRLLFGIWPFWGTGKGRLYFTALGPHPRHLLSELPLLLRGHMTKRSVPENGYYSSNIEEIQLSMQGSIGLDGELYTLQSLAEPAVLKYGGTASFLRW